MPGGPGRGNVEKYKRELQTSLDEFIQGPLKGAVLEIALDLRQAAEDNSRARLGTEPGAPDVQEGWWAGPFVLDDTGAPPGGDARSRAELVNWDIGKKVSVWNSTYYGYFHELGYYEKGGGARPKWMLRDAVQQIGDRVKKL